MLCFLFQITILFALSFCPCEGFEWKDVKTEFDSGYQFACGFEENGMTRSRPYLHGKGSYSSECSEEDPACSSLNLYEASFRLWYDFRGHKKDLEIRSLFYERNTDNWSIKIGFQEVAWGETFGLYIADLVNPRDYTDPFLNDLGWIRIPVCMFNGQYFHEPWTVQLIVTPIPMNNLYPGKNSPFDVIPEPFHALPLLGPSKFSVWRWGKDVEYGIKINYLFESGIDISVFYLRHWNRNPAYKVGPHDGKPVVKPELKHISTFGATISKAFEKIVLRGDTVFHLHEPWTVHRFGIVRLRNVWRTILGLDYTTDEGTSIGAQLHSDYWREKTLYFASFRYYQEFGKDKQYKIDVFLYHGLNNYDCWIQPKFSWEISDSWELELRADILAGVIGSGTPTSGYIGPYRKKDRIFVWLTHYY